MSIKALIEDLEDDVDHWRKNDLNVRIFEVSSILGKVGVHLVGCNFPLSHQNLSFK